MSDDLKNRSTRAAGIVGIAIMCSRLLGLLREIVLAALFGAARNMDAFFMAFKVPNMLRDLFAEGALSMAFVTTFSKKIERDGEQSAWQLASKVATLTVVFMSAITLLGVIFAPQIIGVIAVGFDDEKMALTISLTRILFPFILLISLAALVMGMLNARQIFAAPAFASSFFNLSMITVGAGLGYWIDPDFGERALFGLAVGALVGGLLQLAVQFPSLWKVGYRFRWDFRWRDPGVRKVLVLMGPAVVAASAVQVNVLVNSAFASTLGDGPLSWLQYAFRLMQLPLGIFGVAIGTVTLPLISRSAERKDIPEFRGTLSRGIRLAMLLTIPSALGLAILAEPIISVIFQRGRFDVMATYQAAGALRFYSLGLIAYAALKVVTPAFYALDKRNTPMLVGFLAIATNLFLNWFFTFKLGLGHRGLALSTSLVATINFLILYALMRKHVRRLDTRVLLVTLFKILIAGGVLSAICYGAYAAGLSDWADMPFPERLIWLLSTVAVAATGFFACSYILQVNEMRDIADIIRSKIARKRHKP